MAAAPEVVVESTADQLAQRTADRVATTLVAALQARPEAHLVVTGGSILEQVFAALSVDALDWTRVHLWWGDERFVPSDSADRNDRAAFAAGLSLLPFEPVKVHAMPASDGLFGDDVDTAAAGYATRLAAFAAAGGDVPSFDVVLLGVGPDGHCASLFPGHPGTRETVPSVIAVRESPKPPPVRTSLTFRALDAARQVWFVVAGDGKAEAVARAVAGAPREEVPSAGPRGTERTLWLLDEAAASRLPGSA